MANPEDSNTAEQMSAYLDEELPPEEAEAFESFLADSPEAQAELDDLRKMVSLVSNLPSVEAPDDFYEKVSRKLRRHDLLKGGDGLVISLISLPFQVLSILVILTIAALYMMAQLDQDPAGALERDPTIQPEQPEADAADAARP